MLRMKRTLLATSIAAVMMAPIAVQAQSVTWAGGQSNDWFEGANWNPAIVPGAADDVLIDTDANTAVIQGNADAIVHDIVVGDQAVGELAITNGSTLSSAIGVIGAETGSQGTVSIDGAVGIASWTLAGNLGVGVHGNGVLNIRNNGELNSVATVLGGSGGSGTVLVDNAAWSNATDLFVGQGGAGAISVQNGGVLNNGRNASIGVSELSTGTVTVDGVGSSWTNGDIIFVGDRGNGVLNVLNGGSVSTDIFTVGQLSSGALLIDGPESSMTAAGSATIGNGGEGTLIVRNGGTLGTGSAHIGFAPEAIGNAIVDGTGSKWVSTSNIEVGFHGVGTLTVQNGGTVSNEFFAEIGGQEGTGMVTVDGDGSTWTNTGELLVGNFGTGTLVVSNGGQVSNTDAVLGNFVSFSTGQVATGAATIDGQNSFWTNHGSLEVGPGGIGSLAIRNGASVNVDSNLAVGGSLDLTDEAAGNGALTISSGGSLLGSGGAVIGATAGSQGQVIVDGADSVMDIATGIFVGVEGTGTLTVQQGQVHGAFDVIGAQAGGVGTATVDGQNSVWTNLELRVGGVTGAAPGDEGGNGALFIKNSGTVVTGGNGFVGEIANAVGTVSVQGANSAWNVNGDLAVGQGGAGTLEIDDSGAVEVTGVNSIGVAAGSHGAASVSSGARWSAGHLLFVGREGIGELKIDSGGQVLSGSGVIGELAGSVGAATVTGAGSSWIQTSDIAVGRNGAGTLNILDGGQVQVDIGAIVGEESGSSGTLLVDGNGSRLDGNGAALKVGAAGSGLVIVRNGGEISDMASATLGEEAGSRADVLVDGVGSMFSTAAGISLENDSRMTISGGGVAQTQFLTIGGASGSNVDVLVTGQNSALELREASVSAGGELSLQDGGRVFADSGSFVGDGGAINIGAQAGQAAVAAGIFDVPTLEFLDGGALNFNHIHADYSFAAAISGAGTVNVLSGTTTLTAANTYTGATQVSGGKLLVEGSLDGSAVTVTGGALGGRGSIAGQVNIAAGGTIAPGASIGTLTLNGDFAQSAGSTYEAEIDAAGNSDRIAVSGAAQLAGAVTVLGETALNKSYTLLTAGSGISGQYDTLNSATITPFLNFALRYDPNAVFLDVTRSALTFASLGATRNQIATGAALDRLSASSPLLGAVVGLDQPTALGALDRLSGEIHASTRGLLLEDGRFVRDAANQRLRASQNHGERNGWIQAYGNSGGIDHDGNAAETDIGSGGVLLGADMAAGDARWGVMGGTGRISVQADERHSKANSDSLYFGAYGGTHWGAWGLRAGLAYGRHDVETERKVAFGGLNETLRANYDVETTQAFVEAAYRIDTGRSSFEPYLNLAAIKAENDAYSEAGGVAALRGQEEDTDTGLMTLGLRAATQFEFGDIPASLHGSLGWRHAFGDTVPLSHHAFAGGDAFVIAGARIAEDAAVASARLDLQLSERATLGLGYSGQLGDDSRENSVQAQLQVKF